MCTILEPDLQFLDKFVIAFSKQAESQVPDASSIPMFQRFLAPTEKMVPSLPRTMLMVNLRIDLTCGLCTVRTFWVCRHWCQTPTRHVCTRCKDRPLYIRKRACAHHSKGDRDKLCALFSTFKLLRGRCGAGTNGTADSHAAHYAPAWRLQIWASSCRACWTR